MTEPKDPSGKVVAEILAGRHDGHLVDLTEAVVERIRSSTVRICWRLRIDGDVWDENTVTAGELACAEKLLSTERRPFSYTQLEPKSSIGHRTALVVAHLHKIQGADIKDAVQRAEAITLAEHEKLLELYEVTDDPKAPEPRPETSPPS